MVTDNAGSNNQTKMYPTTKVTLNSTDMPTMLYLTPLTIQRTGSEQPILSVNTLLVNPLLTYTSKYSEFQF